jgi:hypothetical protein
MFRQLRLPVRCVNSVLPANRMFCDVRPNLRTHTLRDMPVPGALRRLACPRLRIRRRSARRGPGLRLPARLVRGNPDGVRATAGDNRSSHSRTANNASGGYAIAVTSETVEPEGCRNSVPRRTGVLAPFTASPSAARVRGPRAKPFPKRGPPWLDRIGTERCGARAWLRAARRGFARPYSG